MEDIPCFWIDSSNIFTMTILFKVICRFNAIPVKLPIPFSTELEPIILKYTGNHTWPRTAKAVLTMKNKAGDIPLTDITQYTVSYRIQSKEVLAQKQTCKTMEKDRNPSPQPSHLWSTPMANLWQRKQEYTKGKRQVPQQVVLVSRSKLLKAEPHAYPSTKSNPKQLVDLNRKHHTMHS